MEQDREEGEMSDHSEMLVDGDDKLDYEESTMDPKCTVIYKADKAGLMVKQLKKIDASKLEERAKRFGLNLTGNKIVTQRQIDELYSNSGIESGNERHFRFDTLHLHGVYGLNTKEIFEYLEDYKPVSLEWIDDNSCNIVCQDHISAALALLVHSREIKDEDLRNILFDKSSYNWREGMPHPKQDMILLRFATNGDKKMAKKIPEHALRENVKTEHLNNESKNPWGDLCRSWGVYDHQEIFQRKLPQDNYYQDDNTKEKSTIIQPKNKQLAKRLGKRNYVHEEDDEDSNGSDSEWKKKSKAPRMRMHADDEESKQKRKPCIKPSNVDEVNIYAPLSIEVNNSTSIFTPKETKNISEKFKNSVHTKTKINRNIQSRLGTKVVQYDEVYSSDECSSADSDHNIMSRVEKVSRQPKSSDVWSRLEVKPSSSNQKDLRQILSTRKSKSDVPKDILYKSTDLGRENKTDDLREKISKSKQCNLRIEIDNNYAK